MNSSDLTSTSVSRVEGFVEIVDETGIYGWAYDVNNPAMPVRLDLLVDGEFEATLDCSQHRPDVKAAGYPRSDVGFHWKPTAIFCDGLSHRFTLSNPVGKIELCSTDFNGEHSQFTFSRHFDIHFYETLYKAEIEAEAISPVAHWRKHRENFSCMSEYRSYLAKEGINVPGDFSPAIYKFINSQLVNEQLSDELTVLHYLQVGHRIGLKFKVADESFIHDLYASNDMSDYSPNKRLESPSLIGAKYTSIVGLLAEHRITSLSLLQRLSVDDYVVANSPYTFRNVTQCVFHFCQYGLNEIKPLSFTHAFDPTFYAEAYPGLKGLPAVELYLDWLNIGIDSGRSPNPSQFMKARGLTKLSQFPSGIDVNLYRAKNPDLPESIFESRWKVLDHLLETGIEANRSGCEITINTADLYRIVADRLAIDNRLQAAKILYERVLLVDPENALGLRHYGDCLLRLGEVFQAAIVYGETIKAGKHTVWTYLNLANARRTLGDYSGSLHALEKIVEERPGDEGLKRALRDGVTKVAELISEEAHWLAKNGFKKGARDKLQTFYASLENYYNANQLWGKRRSRPVECVNILADIGLPQCKFYRVDQKLEQLAYLGIEGRVFDYTKGNESFLSELTNADAVIFYRLPASIPVMEAILAARRAGLPTFFDLDDLMFEDAHFPEDFDSYGGQITTELYATLITGSVALRQAMSLCDYALASTPPLAEAMAKYVRKRQSFVHPNGLSLSHVRAVKGAVGRIVSDARERPVRIFYGSGTKAHGEDFSMLVAPALASLLEKYGTKIQLVFLGYVALPECLQAYKSSIFLSPPIWDLQQYWSVLSSVDINIAVLKSGAVSDAKSEIKWLEAAMFGIPSVVSATATYVSVLQNGLNVLIASTVSEWFRALDRLVSSSSRRQKIGHAAYGSAMANYSISRLAEGLVGNIASAITRIPVTAKRILVVNVFYPPQAIGGATRVVADNVRYLANNYSQEFEFTIFTTVEGATEPYLESVYMDNSVPVFGVTTPSDPEIDQRMEDPDMVAKFRKCVTIFCPDLVHFHCIQRITPSVGQVLVEESIPYIVTLHDGWWISGHQFIVDKFGVEDFYRFDDPLLELSQAGVDGLHRSTRKREFLANANALLAVSEAFANIYRQHGFSNVRVNENGVSNLTVRERRPSLTGNVRLAHVGGASGHKGFSLVRAALCSKLFKNLELLVIDHALDIGIELSEVWGSTPVLIRGKFKQEQVADLYDQVDILLAPSLWPESYGLVSREALLSGCRVIASDRGAIGSDITHGVNGWIIDVKTPGPLIDVLSLIDLEPDHYREKIEPVELRTAEMQSEELCEIYRSLLGNRGGGLETTAVVSLGLSSDPKPQNSGAVLDGTEKQRWKRRK